MPNPKDDKGQPTAREQALARRAFKMREVLGMQPAWPSIPPYVTAAEETPRDPKKPIGQ